MHPSWSRAAVLAAVSAALLMFAGAVAAGVAGIAAAAAVIAAMAGTASYLSERIALSAMRARAVSEVEYPKLYRAVREVSMSARLPVPRIYVSPAMQPNSFVTGHSRRTVAVCCTEGLLRALSVDELRGVLGHELAHVSRRDIQVSSFSAGLAAIITFAASIGWFLPFGRVRYLDKHDGGMFSSRTMLVLGPVAALLLHLLVSPAREFQADALGARLAGDPLALARALRKIEAGIVEMPMFPTGPLASVSHLMIVNPFSSDGFTRLFSTHPPTRERVFRLEGLAGYPR